MGSPSVQAPPPPLGEQAVLELKRDGAISHTGDELLFSEASLCALTHVPMSCLLPHERLRGPSLELGRDLSGRTWEGGPVVLGALARGTPLGSLG